MIKDNYNSTENSIRISVDVPDSKYIVGYMPKSQLIEVLRRWFVFRIIIDRFESLRGRPIYSIEGYESLMWSEPFKVTRIQ